MTEDAARRRIAEEIIRLVATVKPGAATQEAATRANVLRKKVESLIATALAEARWAERERCARELDDKADQVDAIAAGEVHHEWLHGVLTDKAIFLRNLAAALRPPDGAPGEV